MKKLWSSSTRTACKVTRAIALAAAMEGKHQVILCFWVWKGFSPDAQYALLRRAETEGNTMAVWRKTSVCLKIVCFLVPVRVPPISAAVPSSAKEKPASLQPWVATAEYKWNQFGVVSHPIRELRPPETGLQLALCAISLVLNV